MSKTPDSPISKFPLVRDSTYWSSGSSDSMMAILPATQLMMACKTLYTSCPSMHPHYPQMICQLDLFCDGSAGSLPDCTLNSYKWLNMCGRWMIGESQPTSSNTVNTTKNTRKSTQKFISSSWMPLLLSKIMPCASKGFRLPGVLKVLLTLKGWVPSPPMPSGAHASWMMKMKKKHPALTAIAKDCDSEEEVMKQPSGLVMRDD
jgi:hypothetical protein